MPTENRPSDRCRLCDRVTPLERSHIIPKFVFALLKETGRQTGFRAPPNMNKRYQDGPTERWLCRGCEAELSKHEAWFATRVLRPHVLEGATDEVSYDPHLYAFATGLIWRALVGAIESDTVVAAAAPPAERAERKLRGALRGFWDPDPVPISLICTDYVPNIFAAIGKGRRLWSWLLRRTCRIEVMAYDGAAFAIVLIPSFCFIADLNVPSSNIFGRFAIDVMSGHADLRLSARDTPVWLSAWFARAADDITELEEGMSPRQAQAIQSRLGDFLPKPGASVDHQTATALRDLLARESVDPRELADAPCFCGSPLSFHACHGATLIR